MIYLKIWKAISYIALVNWTICMKLKWRDLTVFVLFFEYSVKPFLIQLFYLKSIINQLWRLMFKVVLEVKTIIIQWVWVKETEFYTLPVAPSNSIDCSWCWDSLQIVLPAPPFVWKIPKCRVQSLLILNIQILYCIQPLA